MRLKSFLPAAAFVGAFAAGIFNVGNAFATDIRDVLTVNDGANGASTYEVSYDGDNDITTLNMHFRFDGAAVTKILNQASGKGSNPASFYASVDPHYGFSTPLGKGNFNYDPNNDTFTTQQAIWDEFDAEVEDCSAYYAPYFGPTFSCDSWAYWSSNSSTLWQDYAYVEYKKDGVWVDARGDNVNFAVPADAGGARAIKYRLMDALGLESEDELVYGENWRVKAKPTATVWVYTDTSASTYPNYTRAEYFKIYGSLEAAFDYMAVDGDGEYIYQPDLETALASEYDTVIVNKNTEVDRLVIPEGKTLIEREGEITISDPLHSQIVGTYQKQDGKNYRIVKPSQTGMGLMQLTDGEMVVEVGSEVALDIQIPDGTKMSRLTVNGEDIRRQIEPGELDGFVGGFVMPDEDVSLVAEFEDWGVEISEAEYSEAEIDEGTLEFISEQIMALVEGGENYNRYLSMSAGHVKALLKLGEAFTVSYEEWGLQEEIEDEDWDGFEAGGQLKELLRENEKIINKRGGYLLVNDSEGNDFGMVYELGAPMKLRFDLPEDLPAVADGFERTFYLLRGHINTEDEETAERIKAEVDGNVVSVDNDKFSTFILTYEDTEIVKTPETGWFSKIGGGAKEIGVGLGIVAVGMVMAGTWLMSEGFRMKKERANNN